MKIKSAEHCPEMEQMLKTMPKWIYYIGNALIISVFLLLFFIGNQIQYKQIKNIPIKSISLNDTIITIVVQAHIPQISYLTEGELYLLQFHEINNTPVDSLCVKLLPVGLSNKSNLSADSINSVTCYIPRSYIERIVNATEYYHSLVYISRNTLIGQIKKSFRFNN